MPTLTICCNCCIYLQDRLLYLSTIAAPDFLPNTSNALLEHSDYPFSLLTTEAINESCVICLEKSNYHILCFVSLSINNRGQMLSKVMFSHTQKNKTTKESLRCFIAFDIGLTSQLNLNVTERSKNHSALVGFQYQQTFCLKILDNARVQVPGPSSIAASRKRKPCLREGQFSKT